MNDSFDQAGMPMFLVAVAALVSAFFISGEATNALQAAGVAAIIVAIYLVGQLTDRSEWKLFQRRRSCANPLGMA